MQNVMCLADNNGNIATWPSSDKDKYILRQDKRQLVYNISNASLSREEVNLISDSGINHEDMTVTNAIILAASLPGRLASGSHGFGCWCWLVLVWEECGLAGLGGCT